MSKARLSDWLRLFSYRNYPNYLAVVVGALAARGEQPIVRGLVEQFLLFGICLYTGIYTLNSVLDADLDRVHPVKRERPIASGRISRTQALAFVAVLWVIAFAATEGKYRPLYLAFIAVNLAYSLFVKRHGIRNLIAVTAGMRAALGFVVAGREPFADPALLVLASLFMAGVQQVKFHHEGTRGGEHTGPKLALISAAMAVAGVMAAPGQPLVVAWCAFAMVAWVFVPWRFPQLARWLIGADVPEPRPLATTGTLVAFDFDGTLCDSMRLVLEAVNECAPKYGFEPIDEPRFQAFRGMSVLQIQKTLGLSTSQLVRIARFARRRTAERIGTLESIAGMEEALRELRTRRHRLAVVTSNSAANVKAFFRARGIEGFEEVNAHRGFGTGLWGKPAQLRALMRRYRYDVARFVYVCDEIRDIAAARAVGMPVIAVTWGANSAEALAAAGPTLSIDHPAQLADAIEEALARHATTAETVPVLAGQG